MAEQAVATPGQSAGTTTPETQPGATQTPQTKADLNANGANGATLNDKGPDIVRGTGYNVLHNYRSYNYLFTLAALEPGALTNPDDYKNSSLKYVIAKSAGKGSSTISNSLSSAVVNTKEINSADIISLINEFNSSSPGRFDFNIDNVEINTLMAGNEASSLSLPTKIKFDIVEPYSMGGFLEALEVASKAVGALTYVSATYVLKIEFIGYKHTDNVNDKPEIIDGTTRYYPMIISKVEVETTDRGTKYMCQATPINEMGFGESNKLLADLKGTGSTVGQVITSMFTNLNAAVQDAAKKVKGDNATSNYDTYEVFFAPEESVNKKIVASRSAANATLPWTSAGSIWAAEMNKEQRGNNTPGMADPASAEKGQSGYKVNGDEKTNATTIKYNTTEGAVHFPASAQIHEAIAAVIRDSEYVKDLISQGIEKAKKGDGFVTYFMVRIETEYLEKQYDPQTLKRNQLYRYVIQPYKIHYTRLPGEALGISDFKGALNQIQRTYDYLYMGKNKDVINFNLKFNHLYFQAMPPNAGNKDSSDKTVAAGAPNTPEVGAPKANIQQIQAADGKAVNPPVIQSADQGSQVTDGLSGQKNQASPYHQIAKSMHAAVLQSVDLAKCTIEIYGDPYYIVTGGIGNQSHKIAGPGITENGESPLYASEPYVLVNFRTPIDIKSFEKGGLMEFESQLLPFSGIYRALSVVTTFQTGVFKQKLTLIRMPGQVIENPQGKPVASIKETPKAGEQIVKDTVPAGVQTFGIKANDFTLANLLGRGLPSAGLPGVLSNFTNAAGGAGIPGSITGALNSVAGAGGMVQNLVGQVKTIAPQLGINVGSSLAGVSALASGIRLATSGVSNIIGGVANAPSAVVSQANSLVGSVASIPNGASSLATGVVNQVSGLAGNASALASNLGTSALGAVTSLGASANSLISGVGSKLTALQGTSNDPKALAASLGIDPAQLSGLDPSLISKVTSQLADIKDKLPPNVDIGTAKSQGVIMSAISSDNIVNLPPLEQVIKDAKPTISVAADQFENLAKSGATVAGLSGIGNIPGLTNNALISNALGQASGGLSAGLGNLSVTSLTDKLGSAQSSLNSLVASNIGAGLLPAQAGLGSVESNASALISTVQGAAGNATNLAKTATAQFGSNRTASPLDNLIASNNAATSNNNLG